MDIGVVVPQVGGDSSPDVLARLARVVADRGYEHLLGYDHVLGANADREGGWSGPYDHTDPFHEPLTLFSWLAGQVPDLSFVTGVLVLPQRQTALVAKQAAQLDRLSDGRLRLGVGVGWNPLEYVALDQPFERRGARIEEQVDLLRALWTEELVDVEGEFHTVPDMGLNPLPVQQPIPLWMGGEADAVLRRVARTADGWIPLRHPGNGLTDQLETLDDHARAAGRDPADIGLHGRLDLGADPDGWLDRLEAWATLDEERAGGVDFLAVDTTGVGRSPDEHLAAVERFADLTDAAGIDRS